ncbi:MAG: hypothetical protein SFX19_03530 [Alphaproteobacteria bacterium]|nr:hypothetical protein [Alphaproteobacteria bacterium]
MDDKAALEREARRILDAVTQPRAPESKGEDAEPSLLSSVLGLARLRCSELGNTVLERPENSEIEGYWFYIIRELEMVERYLQDIRAPEGRIATVADPFSSGTSDASTPLGKLTGFLKNQFTRVERDASLIANREMRSLIGQLSQLDDVTQQLYAARKEDVGHTLGILPEMML